MKHLENNLLINDSCLTNLLSFLDTVTGYVDSGSAVDVIFLDLAKAFDKVPHRKLILKFQSHGITGFVSKWTAEWHWLRATTQRVCIRGKMCRWRNVLSGVPQGSVSGPILFLIYINDLNYGVRNWILQFADDTKIFGKALSKQEQQVSQLKQGLADRTAKTAVSVAI